MKKAKKKNIKNSIRAKNEILNEISRCNLKRNERREVKYEKCFRKMNGSKDQVTRIKCSVCDRVGCVGWPSAASANVSEASG